MNSDDVKGVVLVRYEDGTPKCLPKITYLRMIKAGRKITLLKGSVKLSVKLFHVNFRLMVEIVDTTSITSLTII